MRWMTRSMYASSSFVPATTSSTVAIAVMTSAATIPDPNPPNFYRALRERVDDTEYGGVENEEQEKQCRDCVRKPNRRDEWRENRIEGADQERCQQRHPEVPDVEPREDSGCEKDACSADEERQEQPCGRSGGLTSVRRGRLPYVEAPSSGGDIGGP